MIRRRLIERAPKIPVSKSLLQQTISWSRANEPISFRQFLVSRAPVVAKALELKEPALPEGVRSVQELGESDLIKVVCARLREGTENLRLAIVDKGDFTMDELIKEVEQRTDLGRRLVSATKYNIQLLEELAEAGKIQEWGEVSLKLPVIDF